MFVVESKEVIEVMSKKMIAGVREKVVVVESKEVRAIGRKCVMGVSEKVGPLKRDRK